MPEKKKQEKFNRGEIIIYKSSKNEVELRVRFEDETVWLTQKLIAELFGVTIPTINEHLKNIFGTEELDRNSVIRNFRITASDGKEYDTKHYNLDAIIALGYRVNSKIATKFRIWATKVLKNYLLKGYVINEKRLLEARNKFNELQTAISFLQKQASKKQLKGQEKEILNLLADYSKTLSLLEKYDKNKLKTGKGQKAKFVLEYQNCLNIIFELKKNLVAKKEASELFGSKGQNAFESVVKNLYQTFGGKELYRSIENKAAHLLYLTIKDHPFVDGNKRIGSFLFVYFLDKNDYLYRNGGEKKINDNALTALALLIAESDPKEKDVLIKVAINLLGE